MSETIAAVGFSQILGVNTLLGMCTGSIPMVGGHGTADAFGPTLEGLGLEGAKTLCTAAATFGLIAGSPMGGSLGRRLILKHDLLKTAVPVEDTLPAHIEDQAGSALSKGYAPANIKHPQLGVLLFVTLRLPLLKTFPDNPYRQSAYLPLFSANSVSPTSTDL